MKKNFVKKLALGLAFTVAVSSVPTTNAAAAETTYPSFKSVTTKENRKALKVGQTKKYYTKDSTKWALKRINVGNDDVATARFSRTKKFIKVTGVTVGKTQVRAVFKNYKTKEVYKGALLHVEIKEAEKEDVVVSSVPEIKEFIATKVNQLTATFASPVNTDDVTLAVTKGNSKIENTVAWNADKTVATITTVAKLTKGTYTLTATAKSDAVVKTANASVENQQISDIVILNTVALTGKGTVTGSAMEVPAAEAYVYYDVLDQYGDSLRTSASITWSSSCGKPVAEDRGLGKLTLKRSDKTAFTYGEQIFIAGVNGQTGKAVNATLTVGAEQALNTVEVKGFVKKNTSEILTTLPSGFKSEAYYMIYTVADQNGNPMKAKNYLGDQEVTFISDNVLLLEKFEKTTTLVTIDGITYSAVEVVPGMYVDQGGEVNITAIANKTGNKSTLNVVIGENAILRSFVMSSPELIADGEAVEIPFVATDMNGNEIKNFTVLADNINELNFSASNATLQLEENNDGTASLWLYDSKTEWDTDSADGIDRPIALTAIVVGGETNNLMVNIKDKARPDAIYSVDAPEVLVENQTDTIYLAATDDNHDGRNEANFTFLDQYGRKIKNYVDAFTSDKAGNSISLKYNDNGFFEYASKLSNTEFNGYKFGVKVTYTGNTATAVTSGAIDVDNLGDFTSVAGEENTYEQILTVGDDTASLKAPTDVVAAVTGENLQFEIVKYDSESRSWNAVSTAYNTSFAVADITQVKNFMVMDLNKQYADTSGKIANVLKDVPNSVESTDYVLDSGSSEVYSHAQTAVVVGNYNGKTVIVPGEYLDASAKLMKVVTGPAVQITTEVNDDVKWKEFYDLTTAKDVRKDAADTLTVEVLQPYTDGINKGGLYDTVVKGFTVSNAKAIPTTIVTEDAYTYNPVLTEISNSNLDPEKAEDFYRGDIRGDEDGKYRFIVKDQYGKTVLRDDETGTYYDLVGNSQTVSGNMEIAYQISNVVENADGYAENNFKVSGNATSSAAVEGAERGDTFVLTINAKLPDGKVYASKNINITVGSDGYACISDSNNAYLDTLVNIDGKANVNGLEQQREAVLK